MAGHPRTLSDVWPAAMRHPRRFGCQWPRNALIGGEEVAAMQPGQPGNPGDPRVTRRVPAVQPGPQPAFELPVLPDTSATAATAAQIAQGQMSGRYMPGAPGSASRMPASLGVTAMTGMTGANAMTGSAPAFGVLPSRSLPPSPSAARPQAAQPAAETPADAAAFGPREPTLTQRMRSLQPPDV